MNFKDIESRLAWLGALVVLVAVSAAASSAFAAEPVADQVAAVAAAEPVAVAIAGAQTQQLQSYVTPCSDLRSRFPTTHPR